MDELRVAFLVIGSLFIVAVLVHGIWKMRKQNASKQTLRDSMQSRIEPNAENDGVDDEHSFDELGVGPVRVISEPTQHRNTADDDPLLDTPVVVDDLTAVSGQDDAETGADNESQQQAPQDQASQEPSEVEEPSGPVYASVVSQPKPHLKETPNKTVAEQPEEAFPEPPEFLLHEEQTLAEQAKTEQAKTQAVQNAPQEPDFNLSEPEQPASQDSQQAVAPNEPATAKPALRTNKKRGSIKRRKEPTLGDDQMRIDFDEASFSATDEPIAPQEPMSATDETKAEQKPQSQEQEVLVLNVRADDENPLSGAALLPMLLTLGFKFGDQDIFHRHVNANGKGPVLFSLANMVKPGVFDIDNLENFTTPGISLFMVLPIEGDPHQVFNMMHNAARKIADAFNAQVLDGRRSVLTKQGIQQYVEKIREFERQRIIARSAN